MSMRRQTQTFLPAIPGATGIIPGLTDGAEQSQSGQVVRYNQPPEVPGSGYTGNRLNFLEDRVALQEKNTATLVERAYKIREDIVESLNLNHGSWREEKRARELLQDHIRTITDVVRRMNYDVQGLESQLRAKEAQNEQLFGFMRQLEVGQVGGVTDIRGRVLRCDAALARLASDISSASLSYNALAQRQQQDALQTGEQFHGLDTRMREVINNMEKNHVAQQLQMEKIDTALNHQMTSLESRLTEAVRDLEVTVQSNRQAERQEREHMETRLMQYFNRILDEQDKKLDRLSDRLEESISDTSAAIESLHKLRDADVKHYEKRLNEIAEDYETRLLRLEQKNDDELRRLTKEYRTSLKSLEENVSAIRELFENKIEVAEEQLNKEISQVRRMCVYN